MTATDDVVGFLEGSVFRNELKALINAGFKLYGNRNRRFQRRSQLLPVHRGGSGVFRSLKARRQDRVCGVSAGDPSVLYPTGHAALESTALMGHGFGDTRVQREYHRAGEVVCTGSGEQ